MGKKFKLMAAIFSWLLLLTTLSACSSTTVEQTTPAAGAQMSSVITFEADDWQITLENTQGKTVRQLLEEADIVLEESDVLSVNPEQIPYEGMTIQVLRKHVVTVSSAQDGSSIRIILLGGTVADALEAAGISMTDEQQVNYPLNQPLEDSMEITVSVKKEETTTTTAETTVTEATETTETTTVTTTAVENSANRPAATNKTTTKATTKTKPATTTTKPAATTTKPVTQTTTTTPAATEAERTIVSIEIYEDCDGSGHGVKVITYSDGTQEEVPF